jgi:pimeloyl-ACP methyl ester carboxylesterase
MGPESKFVEANGLRLHVRDWGGDGTPIVLLHGLASNARIWDFVAPLLASYARVVAIDQRGHGLSDRPEDGYSHDEVTADLAELVDALQFERPAIVGHSWGANVAVCFAAQRPDRVAGVALVDGGTFELAAGMSWEEAERTMAPPRLAGTPRARFLELVNRGDMGKVWSEQVEQILLANFDVREDDTIAPRLTFERHMKIVRAIYEYHPQELLPRIESPVLMLPTIRDGDREWAERKRAAVARAEQLAPRAQTHWFEDAIHDVPLQRPGEVAQVLVDFLRSL